MVESSVKILLVEDDLAEARLLQEVLTQYEFQDFHIFHVQRLSEALQELENQQPPHLDSNLYDIVLLDLTLPDSDKLSSLTQIIRSQPTLPIVVLTNTNDDELAVEAVRKGAQDYLVKRQVNDKVLSRSIRYAIERKQVLESLREVNNTLESEVQERTTELIRAKEINQLKSEFVSILSHDIRNPLNAILLAAGMLKNSDEKLSPEKKLSHYKVIRSAIKNMALLLDEASFIGKADSGRLECKMELLDIRNICLEMIEDAQLSLLDKKIDLIFNTFGEVKDIWCNENLLHHILDNLISNAIKYSPSESTIQFKLSFTEKNIIFDIKDEGIGIPFVEKQSMFQAFNRASNVGSIPGTGLGLAIVKKCVDILHGEVLIDSDIGFGSTFTVKLPIIS
ncbi:MAG: hybrid sensor histidine kinase/response regulator [Cyanobacteria bacterium P01_A01_bin.45]